MSHSLPLPESFKDAKTNLAMNLSSILKTLNYTATSMAMQLKAISSTEVLSTDITSWTTGEKIPNIYQLFKLTKMLNVPMDAFFSSDFKPSIINNPIIYSLGDEKLFLANLNQTKENLMATTNTSVTVSKTSMNKMNETVKAHTNSTTYNALLANKIYSSPMTLKEISTKVGMSTRSLRDYCLYGTSVPETVAQGLVKLFKTSYRNLGLTYNKEIKRYEHMEIKVK